MFFVEDTIQRLVGEFEEIPSDRKLSLKTITTFVEGKIVNNDVAQLVFICTHNSRRSHIAQVWAQTAASYFGIPNVKAYSGGTEATAFNPRAVDAMRGIGFNIKQKTTDTNPRYVVQYSNYYPGFEVFSKRYDDRENPSNDFAAIMTCTHADENCPIVIGATARISLPFHDPKDFDGTSLESAKYRERSLEIGREILYAFSQIKRL
jgi:arsenate reductase